MAASDKFDIHKTVEKWAVVPVDPAERPVQVDTQKYIDAYRELVKFFNICGSGFGFVISDVVEKLDILQEHLTKRDGPKGNTTLQKMILWEKANGEFKKDPKRNGARTLLRLNRAAEFIMLLIEYIVTKEGDKMSQSTWEAYEKTLANYHPWVVRKAVGVAVYAIPAKETLIQKMEITKPEAVELLPKLVEHQRVVFEALLKVYDDEKLQDLP
eukprot:comp22889_c0_seq1/m.36178 comp22889_c0_seq1/g.36178  ORF comp22889_c0_seq1/g.36178 comp22889_c0_seq1/m.36178 type:complete len:213 (-) comp22889_c0_seq1:26-664(-)